jgi:hypothetical protein
VKIWLAQPAHHRHYLGIERHDQSRRGIMGDKGGKKDKEKEQKQKAGKQIAKAKDKQDKSPNKKA